MYDDEVNDILLDETDEFDCIIDDGDDEDWFELGGGLTAEAQDFLGDLDSRREFI